MKLQKADFHIHTNYSDGEPQVEKILDYIQNKTDLTVIAISDHDTVDGALKALKISKNHNYRFYIIVGEEISTKDGHLVGLFLKKTIPPGLTVKETIKEIKKQNGIIIAPHPFYQTKFRKNGNLIGGIGLKNVYEERKNIHAIETYNGNLVMFPYENRKAVRINESFLHLPSIGSSDAHILKSIGKSYTLLFGNNLEDIKNSLKLGNTIAKSGTWDIKSIIVYTIYITPNIILYIFWKIKNYFNEIFKKTFRLHNLRSNSNNWSFGILYQAKSDRN